MSLSACFSVTFSQFVRNKIAFDLYQMGIFKNVFKTKEPKEEKVLPWIPLNDIQQLNHIEEKSKTKTQVIFKHSTRCGISRMVINQFVDSYSLTEKDIDLYYLDLLSFRDVSNEVGYKFRYYKWLDFLQNHLKNRHAHPLQFESLLQFHLFSTILDQLFHH